MPRSSISTTPTMPSTTSIINKQDSINQLLLIRPVKTKKSKHPKKVMIHQSGSPLPPDDFVLFPQDVVREKHSSIRDSKPRRPYATKSAKKSSSPMPQHHVIEPKTPTTSQLGPRRLSGRPVRLDHMSTINCTVECVNARSLANLKVPPKAPSPPHLPTPDLSDVEEDDLWSCCGSSWASLDTESSRCNGKAESMWDEMGASLNPWHQGNRIR